MRCLVLFASLVAVFATAVPASAEPPLPADNGWIAFVSDRAELPSGLREYGIYRLDPIGGRIRTLGLLGRQPAWSPDGSLLAFVQGRFRLVIAREDGTRVKAFRSDYPIHEPSWSPDGTRVVLRQTIGPRLRGDLAVVDVTKGGFRKLTNTPHDDTDPTWAPDGTRIAFVSSRDHRFNTPDTEIYVVQPNGRGLHALTVNEFDDRAPSWSPDGSRIAFESGREPGRFNPELWTMAPNGANQRRVQPASAPGGFPSWADMSPGWSPDGRWLVYVTNQRWHLHDIYIVQSDGGEKIDLMPDSAFFDVEPAWQPVCIKAGTPGRDDLRGTLADELICGFGGADSLAGGGGLDRIFGGAGADRIRAADRTFDVVGCGAGPDTVVADRRDLVGTDCERVRRR